MPPFNKLLSKFIFIVLLFHSLHAKPQNFAQNLIDNGLLIFNNQTAPLALAIQAAATIYQPIDSNQAICAVFTAAGQIELCNKTQEQIYSNASTLVESYINSAMYLNYLYAAGSVLNEGYNSGALEIPMNCGASCVYSPLAKAFKAFSGASVYGNVSELAKKSYYTDASAYPLLANGTYFYSLMNKTFLFNTELWHTISDAMKGAPAQPANIKPVLSTMMSSLSLSAVPKISFYQIEYPLVTNDLTSDVEWFTAALSSLSIGNFTMPDLPKELLPTLANCLPLTPYLFDPKQATSTHPKYMMPLLHK